MPPKKQKRSVVRTAGEIILAAGGGAAASMAAGDPSHAHAAAWAAAGAGATIWSRAVELYDGFKASRNAKVFKTLVGPDGDEQAARLLAKLESERWAQEAVFATLREVNQTISEEAVTILAVLLRDYLGAGRPIDSFFLGAQGLFGGLTTDDLKQVKDLLRYLASSSASDDFDLHASIPLTPNSQRVSMSSVPQKVSAVVANAGNPPFSETEPPPVRDGLRLFSLFKSQHLAFASGRLPDSHSMLLSLRTVRRLQRLIVQAELMPP